MNIIEIYKKYHLPENLQMHMLRVAACSNLIMDNWNGPKIDKESIIRVNLLHDMGNMVKIPEDFSKDEEFLKIRKKYFDKYGTNDHEINLEIGKREGLTEKEIIILDGKRSRKNEETLKSNSYERKICAYCDQRVAPDGVVSIKDRLEDAKMIDLPEIVKIQNKKIEKEQLQERIISEECNYNISFPIEKYDDVFLFAVVHQEPKENLNKLLDNIYNVLKPNGRLFLTSFFLNEDRISPEFSVQFAVEMLMNSNNGKVYTHREIENLMKENNFKEIERIDKIPSPATLYLARK